MPGGSSKQQAAREAGLPFALTAWTSDVGRAFYEAHIEPLLPAAWRALERRFPRTCREMLDAVPLAYRLLGTAFTKVSRPRLHLAPRTAFTQGIAAATQGAKGGRWRVPTRSRAAAAVYVARAPHALRARAATRRAVRVRPRRAAR